MQILGYHVNFLCFSILIEYFGPIRSFIILTYNNRINLKPKSFDKLNLFGINLDKNNLCTTKGTTFYCYNPWIKFARLNCILCILIDRDNSYLWVHVNDIKITKQNQTGTLARTLEQDCQDQAFLWTRFETVELMVVPITKRKIGNYHDY